MRFLDRFAYRNPKKVNQSTKNNDDDDDTVAERNPPKKLPKKTSYRPCGARSVAVTSEDYAKMSNDSVPEDEKFLHRWVFVDLADY